MDCEGKLTNSSFQSSMLSLLLEYGFSSCVNILTLYKTLQHLFLLQVKAGWFDMQAGGFLWALSVFFKKLFANI